MAALSFMQPFPIIQIIQRDAKRARRCPKRLAKLYLLFNAHPRTPIYPNRKSTRKLLKYKKNQETQEKNQEKNENFFHVANLIQITTAHDNQCLTLYPCGIISHSSSIKEKLFAG